MKQNPLTAIDFYKTLHRNHYPIGTTLVYSNLTPRSDKFITALPDFDHKIVNYGGAGAVQELKELWDNNFFSLPKEEVLRKYKRRMDNALGKDVVPIDHISALHDVGFLPLAIFELPEGERVDIRVPLFIIYNTKPEFFWLVNYLETALSAELWKPLVSATLAYEYRRLLDRYATLTGAPKEFVPWQGHDFSARGMSGNHDAARTGSGHLLSFYGTDTVSSIDYLEDYYKADAEKEIVGGSVQATEHSVSQTSILLEVERLKLENPNLTETEYLSQAEEIFFERLITKIAPTGIISIVSDTFDFWNVVTNISKKLKNVIMNRNGKMVIRPDSGDPVKIIIGDVNIVNLTNKVKDYREAKAWAKEWLVENVSDETAHGECGVGEVEGYFRYNDVVYLAKVNINWNRYDKQYYYIDGSDLVSFEPAILTPEQKGAVECLWEIFGGTISDKGYKMLDSHIGLIYGDSITLDRAQAILSGLESKGFASNNIVFGIGSFSYNFSTRDTLGIAVKATAAIVNGKMLELYKDPATDKSKLKKSAKGLLRVEHENDHYVLYDQQTDINNMGEFIEIFRDGQLKNLPSLTEIRKRLIGS
jgi:nicotinamide phosphoribosyltransferase